MTMTERHLTAAAVAIVSGAGVWAVNGSAEGVGAATSAAVVVTWVAWTLLRHRCGRGRGDDAPALTDDQCITILGLGSVTYLGLHYLARDEQVANGALGVNLFVGLYLVWAFFGTRWWERRRAVKKASRD